MENIDNPAPAFSSDSFLSIELIVQQINEILIYINKDKPFQLDKNYIEIAEISGSAGSICGSG